MASGERGCPRSVRAEHRDCAGVMAIVGRGSSARCATCHIVMVKCRRRRGWTRRPNRHRRTGTGWLRLVVPEEQLGPERDGGR